VTDARVKIYGGKVLKSNGGKLATADACCCTTWGDWTTYGCNDQILSDYYYNTDGTAPPPTWNPGSNFYGHTGDYSPVPPYYGYVYCGQVLALCPAFTHETGEYAPNFVERLYRSSVSDQPKTFTADLQIKPAQDVHIGFTLSPGGGTQDDGSTIWINGTRALSINLAGTVTYDGSNCTQGSVRWYVVTVGAGETARLQVAGCDNISSETTLTWWVAFWYNGDPAPAGWPGNFEFDIRHAEY